ncbi:MAG TPA: hypothetical protein VKB19_12005 [Pedobacter sp.]|nr:hypothetical protein [Pedobacter sp.]
MRRFKLKGTIIFELFKNLGFGILVLIIGGFIVYNIIGETFTSYLLFNYGETTKGQLNDVTEDVMDKDGGGVEFTFYYSYSFNANSKTVQGGGNANGRIPDEFADALDEPIQVDILYMKANPQINMLKKAVNYSTSYLLKRCILALIVISFGSYLIIKSGKPALKTFRDDMRYHEQALKEDSI